MTVTRQDNGDAENNGDDANRMELFSGLAHGQELQKLPSELESCETPKFPPLQVIPVIPTAPGEDAKSLPPSKSATNHPPINTNRDARVLVSSGWSERRDDDEKELKVKDPTQEELSDEKQQELNVESKHHLSPTTAEASPSVSRLVHTTTPSIANISKKRKGLKRYCGKSFTRVADRYPRFYALFFGFFGPIQFLIVLAALCGYPLALLESPLEMDRNDERLANQMRLLVEVALYTNVTQALPRVCLQLFMINASPGEFLDNVTDYMENPPKPLRNATVNKADNETMMVTNEADQLGEGIANIADDQVDDDVLHDDDFDKIPRGGAFGRTSEEVDAESVLVTGPFQNYYQYDSFLSTLYNAPPNEKETFNVDEMSIFILGCGLALGPLLDRMFLSLSNTTKGVYSDPISFAWSRCPEKGSDEQPEYDPLVSFLDSILIDNVAINWTYPPYETESSAKAQTNQYRENWETDRRRLYQQYLTEDFVTSYENATVVPTIWQRFAAFERSITDATGREGCFPNIPASCWFWFTVMTTIGYGNNSPASFGGKAMVFTLGFAAIILFGASSNCAGTVIRALLEDFAIRAKLLILNRTWVSCFTWASLFGVWMVVIGAYYVAWLKDRLGPREIEPLGIGYWFAYISSTSIGFGDYYLPPAVISAGDCIVYPLMFMFSFSLLANFLTKLAAIFEGHFLDGSHLVQQFQNMDDIKSAEDLGNLPRPTIN